jgi:hypothetical protein
LQAFRVFGRQRPISFSRALAAGLARHFGDDVAVVVIVVVTAAFAGFAAVLTLVDRGEIPTMLVRDFLDAHFRTLMFRVGPVPLPLGLILDG